jgi:hypothetical protein
MTAVSAKNDLNLDIVRPSIENCFFASRKRPTPGITRRPEPLIKFDSRRVGNRVPVVVRRSVPR